MQGKFGNIAVLRGDKIECESLENVIGKENKLVPVNCELVEMAKAMGVCFGD